MSSASVPSQATPKEIWQNAKANLELQMARATYDTWLREARFVAYEDGEFVIGVSSAFALDWLNNRLRPLIKRTLARLMGRAVDVRFVAQLKPARDDLTQPAPLLETLPESPAPVEVAYAAGDAHQLLNSEYTFENYVVGSSNRLASVAAQTVAENLGRSFNPFFMYGGVGLGKTHLMHSIGHEARRQGHRVLYVPAEGFTNDLVESLKDGSPEAFRGKYRTTDVLLLDDVQFIAGKSSTQEELFHTFNALYLAGKQIVLTADSMPDQIAALEKRLSSRFKSGLCVDLQPPGLETRVAILQRKMEAKGLSIVPAEVLDLLARRLPGSVRRLEGALNLVVVQSQVTDEPLSVALAEAALSGWIPQQPSASPEDILSLVAADFGVTVEELKGPGRSARVARPRQVSVLLLHEEAALSRSHIGRLLGGRDHSTIGYGLKRISKLLDSDAELRRRVRMLREELRVPAAIAR
jgi:chromosomal replication initiator protein